MLSFDSVRLAVLSDIPWSRLDELVRAELAAGRTTEQVFNELRTIAQEVQQIPGLSEDGEDAFGDTLDALAGNCRPDCRYEDACD